MPEPEPARPRERIEAVLREVIYQFERKLSPYSYDQLVPAMADALLAASAPDAATPCTGACARHCPTEGRE